MIFEDADMEAVTLGLTRSVFENTGQVCLGTDQELVVEAALQGCGLAYVWDNRVLGHLASGALIRCLDDWCAPDGGLFLYYPSRRYVSAGLRALIQMLKAAPGPATP